MIRKRLFLKQREYLRDKKKSIHPLIKPNKNRKKEKLFTNILCGLCVLCGKN
jgi:hypothetical protein